MADLDKIAATLDALTTDECADLVPMLEEKWGVKAAPAAAPVPTVMPADMEPEVQTEFDVVLTSFGDKKIKVVQAVRKATGLPIKESRDLVEKAPEAVIKEGISETDAQELKAQLEEVGGSVEIR